MAFRAFAVVCNRRRDLVPVVFISPVSNRSPVEQFVPVPPVPRLLVMTGLLSFSTDPPLMASCQQLHTIRGLSCPLSLSIMFSGFRRTKGHLSLAEIVPQGRYVSRLQSSRSSRNRGTNLSLVRPGRDRLWLQRPHSAHGPRLPSSGTVAPWLWPWTTRCLRGPYPHLPMVLAPHITNRSPLREPDTTLPGLCVSGLSRSQD